MIVKLLNEHHLEFLRLKGDCKCSFECTLVKMPHCWKSHVTAHIIAEGEVFNRTFIPVFVQFCIISIGKITKQYVYRSSTV